MVRIPQMAWYVSYVSSGNISGERAYRATRTFANEGEAKSFAKARFDAGDKTLVAGTLNPVVPKRVVPSSAILDWLEQA